MNDQSTIISRAADAPHGAFADPNAPAEVLLRGGIELRANVFHIA